MVLHHIVHHKYIHELLITILTENVEPFLRKNEIDWRVLWIIKAAGSFGQPKRPSSDEKAKMKIRFGYRTILPKENIVDWGFDERKDQAINHRKILLWKSRLVKNKGSVKNFRTVNYPKKVTNSILYHLECTSPVLFDDWDFDRKIVNRMIVEKIKNFPCRDITIWYV